MRSTSLAGKPTMLFLLFGDRADPRVLPVATIGKALIAPITLTALGWRQFDKLYFAPSARLALYRDGKQVPDATLRRGMWSEAEPLYKLPGCRALRPLAAAIVEGAADNASTIELLATSAPLNTAALAGGLPSDGSQRSISGASDSVRRAALLDSVRALAIGLAQGDPLLRNARVETDLSVQAISTGVSGQPTLLASYMEPGGGVGGEPRHLLVLADSTASGYAPSLIHVTKLTTPGYMRLIGHLDLDGDGVDEIVLEGWRTGGESHLMIMKYTAGKWHEVARGETSWCADLKRPQADP